MCRESVKRDIGFILLLLGLTIFFFKDILFTGAIFVYRDFYRIFYPLHYFASQSIKDGYFPLWNPYLYCGIPFLANPQASLLYPPFILTYILSFNTGLRLFIVLHFFFAGLFMYLLLRDWKIGRIGSLAGCITFAFSGYMLSVIEFLNNLSSVVWIPLIFLFFNRALDLDSRLDNSKFEIKWIMLTGLFLGIQFLGGEPTVLYGTLIALFLFAIAKGMSKVRGLKFWIRSIWDKFYLLLACCVIALGLTLFQAIPFLEMLLHSARLGGVEYEAATKWSLTLYELVGMVNPLLSGLARSPESPLGYSLLMSTYLGILPFIFILTAIIYCRKKTCFWIVLFIGSILLCLGKATPLYWFLYKHLPFFSLSRYPVKFFFLTAFSGAILAGLGADYALKIIKKSHLISYGLLMMVILDLFYFGQRLHPLVKEEFYKYESKTLSMLKKDVGYDRVYLTPMTLQNFNSKRGIPLLLHLEEAHDLLVPNLGLLHGLFDVDGYGALNLKDYISLLDIIKERSFSSIHHLLNLLNIKYIISKKEITSKGLKLVYKDGINLYQNLSLLPRAFILPEAVVIQKRDEVLERLLDPEFDLTQKIILEEPNQ